MSTEVTENGSSRICEPNQIADGRQTGQDTTGARTTQPGVFMTCSGQCGNESRTMTLRQPTYPSSVPPMTTVSSRRMTESGSTPSWIRAALIQATCSGSGPRVDACSSLSKRRTRSLLVHDVSRSEPSIRASKASRRSARASDSR